MRSPSSVLSVIVFVLAIVLAGCGHDAPATCEELADKCHDESTPLRAECHALGHDGTAEECEERYDECIEACAE